MSALENVVIGAERDGNALAAGGHAALLRRAQAALDFVGLGGRADETIPSFSYGHQRLIEIARALAANPTVLLLDEPAAGLNSSEKKSLHDLLDRIAAQGLTILIIDHDMTLDRGRRAASDGAQFRPPHRRRRDVRRAAPTRCGRGLSGGFVMDGDARRLRVLSRARPEVSGSRRSPGSRPLRDAGGSGMAGSNAAMTLRKRPEARA